MKSFVVAALLCITACGIDTAERPAATWFGEVGTIVRTKCGGCHRDGGIAPFPLQDAADGQDQSAAMMNAIDSGIMPPFSMEAPPDCAPRRPWRDDPRLTPAELALVHEWAANGAPSGEPRKLPGSPSTTLEDATITLEPAESYTAMGDRDQFVCVLLDPKLGSGQWLTASQVHPTAEQIVHHANVNLVAPGDAKAAIEAMGGIGVPHPNCFTPPGVAFQSWLPGNPALVLGDSIGIPMPKGTLVAIQVHYHPAGGVGVDATSISLRLTREPPRWNYELGVYGNDTRPGHLRADPDDPPSGPVFEIPAYKEDTSRSWTSRTRRSSAASCAS